MLDHFPSIALPLTGRRILGPTVGPSKDAEDGRLIDP